MNEQGSTARPSLDDLWRYYDADVQHEFGSRGSKQVRPEHQQEHLDNIAKGRKAIEAAIKAESESYERLLRNLLARIHRDGGERQAMFLTLAEAVEDADRIVAALNVEHDSLKAVDESPGVGNG